MSVVPEDNNKLRTPENIKTEWINLADAGDKVAQSNDLKELFKSNSNEVGPTSYSVLNDYQSEGIENPHKSFGYLRTPELAQIIEDFLCRGKNKLIIWLTKKFDTIRYKFLSS